MNFVKELCTIYFINIFENIAITIISLTVLSTVVYHIYLETVKERMLKITELLTHVT